MNALTSLIIGPALCLLTAAPPADGHRPPDYLRASAALSRAKVNLNDAIKAATASTIGGTLIKAELQPSAEPTYVIELLTGNELKTIRVDGVSGKVHPSADQFIMNDDPAYGPIFPALAAVKLSPAQALAAAKNEDEQSRPCHLTLKVKGKHASYEVNAIGGGRFVTIRLDAGTGKILDTEIRRAQNLRARFNFDIDETGQVPPDWSIRQTTPTTALATWQVIADDTAPSEPNVFALTKTRNEDQTFNVAIAEAAAFQDLDLSVRVKAVRGEIDQGGGPIWRCRDENNYYICRFNPLEGNFRVYKVVEGRRKQLLSARIETEADRWYAVRVVMINDRIQCYLDDEKLLDVRDATFKDAGLIGLWTKADAVTYFDNLTVAARSRR